MKELMNNAPVLIDVRGMFNGEEAKRKGFYYMGVIGLNHEKLNHPRHTPRGSSR